MPLRSEGWHKIEFNRVKPALFLTKTEKRKRVLQATRIAVSKRRQLLMLSLKFHHPRSKREPEKNTERINEEIVSAARKEIEANEAMERTEE